METTKATTREVCVHYIRGACNAGAECKDLHERVRVGTSARAWNSVCHFYIKNKCRKGGNCPGKHYERPTPADPGKASTTTKEEVSDETKCAMMMKEYKMGKEMIPKELARAWYEKLPDEQKQKLGQDFQ